MNMEKEYFYTKEDFDMISIAMQLYGKEVHDEVVQAFKDNKSPIAIQRILTTARNNMR